MIENYEEARKAIIIDEAMRKAVTLYDGASGEEIAEFWLEQIRDTAGEWMAVKRNDAMRLCLDYLRLLGPKK